MWQGLDLIPKYPASQHPNPWRWRSDPVRWDPWQVWLKLWFYHVAGWHVKQMVENWIHPVLRNKTTTSILEITVFVRTVDYLQYNSLFPEVRIMNNLPAAGASGIVWCHRECTYRSVYSCGFRWLQMVDIALTTLHKLRIVTIYE